MKIGNCSPRVFKNNLIYWLKIGFVLFLVTLVIGLLKEGVAIPEIKSEKRAYFFLAFFVVPLLSLGTLYYLNVLIKEIILERTQILIKKSYFIFYKDITVEISMIEKMELGNGNSSTLIFLLKDKRNIKVETLGLKNFEGQWGDPSYSDFMPSNPSSKIAYKIAYNISKRYEIPFETDFIN